MLVSSKETCYVLNLSCKHSGICYCICDCYIVICDFALSLVRATIHRLVDGGANIFALTTDSAALSISNKLL